MSKRAKVELVDPTNGTRLSENEFLSNIDVVVSILLRMPFSEIGLLSKTSKVIQTIIEKRAIWLYVFQRDFPEVFEYVVTPNTYTMKLDYRQKIDVFSKKDRADRGETYWKRYYEMLIKSERAIELHKQQMPQESGSVLRDPLPTGWSPLGMVDVRPFKDPAPLNPSGLSYNPMIGWSLYRKPLTNIFYYFPSSYATLMGQRPAANENHPTEMIMIDANLLTAERVAYDPITKTYPFIHYRRGNGAVYIRMIDGLSWCLFDSYTSSFSRIFVGDSVDLVSCNVCKSVATGICPCCEQAFCSKACQEIKH